MCMSALRVCLHCMLWALNHLELELKTTVSLHVGVGILCSLDEQPVLTAESFLPFLTPSAKGSPTWLPKEYPFSLL